MDVRGAAVVVGSGSAGRRHAATLRAACPEARVAVVRRPDSDQPWAPLHALGVDVVTDLDEAVGMEPAVAVVAGPAPLHQAAAERLLAGGAHVLVEKPLAHRSDAAVGIVDAARRHGRGLSVGYHLRHGDTVPRLKELLDDHTIGDVTGFDLDVGQHLGQWRPEVDPRRSVSARQELGGGVLLELSHELDGLRYLLGEPSSVKAELGFDGAPTDGLVETVADLDVTMADGQSGHVHLDMVRDEPARRWEIHGTQGTLVADLLDGTITEDDGHAPPRAVFRAADDERGRAERRLIDELLAMAAGEVRPRCTGEDGVAALRFVEAARRSAQEAGR